MPPLRRHGQHRGGKEGHYSPSFLEERLGNVIELHKDLCQKVVLAPPELKIEMDPYMLQKLAFLSRGWIDSL